MLPDLRDYALEITSELMHEPKSGNTSMKHNVCHLLPRKNKRSKNKDKHSPSAAPSFKAKLVEEYSLLPFLYARHCSSSCSFFSKEKEHSKSIKDTINST